LEQSPSPASQQSPQGRIAGIDFGTVRIGIALTDRRRTLASPYEIYTRRTPELDARYFRELAQREEITLFVVGLPVHLSGDDSQSSIRAREFGNWLAATTGVPVEFFDERFTSSEASQLLLGADMTRKRRKARLDKLAAQILLSAYLESPTRGKRLPQRLDDR
jgi:putative Holliday junction resolvase